MKTVSQIANSFPEPIILLDSGPLGLITNPSASEENRECNGWIQTRLRDGDRVMVPAISDYEVVVSCCGRRRQKVLPD